jgi:hypothetical protein
MLPLTRDSATRNRWSFKGAPPELQWRAAGASMVRRRSCKGVLSELQVVNAIFVSIVSVLQARRGASSR